MMDPCEVRPVQTCDRLIGGFFGLELPAPRGGFAELWHVTEGPTFANARSAFAALIQAVDPPRVWLPAYICEELVKVVPGEKLAFYPVGEKLMPVTGILESSTRPGDIVLGVNYFGRPPHLAFLEFVERRQDLVFVEDCAQSIDTGMPPWGHWRLFSPRKLMGVPDGGLLLASSTHPLTVPPSSPMFDMSTFEASIRRFEDEGETQNAAWHAANQMRESAESVSNRRMSRLSGALLHLLDPTPIIARRRANFAALQERLTRLSFLNDGSPAYVPFGFPIRLARGKRDGIISELASTGIFVARHWNKLPSPAQIFQNEHRLASELMTLPCDQRYGPDDIARIAAAVEVAVS
jgi:dTDP-4-amino-4,6-dideoxygalactose transaminase